MKMYNLDGSEGLMSGNAIRGVAKYLYDSDRVNKMQMTIETASGIKNVSLYKMYGEVTSASVDMGKAELKPALVPVALHGDKIVNEPVNIGGEVYNITCVSLGNPHCVVFTDSVETLDIEKIGPTFENNAIFPERVNAEFVKVLDSHTLKMRVWERGNGETWSCGTGAAAAAVAAVLNGYAAKGEDIRVKIHGGELIVNYTDDVVTLKGDTVKIFEGTVVL